MHRRGLFALAAASLLPACGAFDTRRVRFRLTVRALIDGREYEGASVNQIEWKRNLSPGPVHTEPFVPRFWAESPILDLGDNGQIFTLLQPPGRFTGDAFNFFKTGYIIDVLPRAQQRYEDYESGAVYSNLRTAQAVNVVRQRFSPFFVRYTDRNDPTSVRLVDPFQFHRLFGSDASFLGLFVEVVDAPLTHEIVEWLPWLAELPDRASHRGGITREYGAELYTQLTREHF